MARDLSKRAKRKSVTRELEPDTFINQHVDDEPLWVRFSKECNDESRYGLMVPSVAEALRFGLATVGEMTNFLNSAYVLRKGDISDNGVVDAIENVLKDMCEFRSGLGRKLQKIETTYSQANANAVKAFGTFGPSFHRAVSNAVDSWCAMLFNQTQLYDRMDGNDFSFEQSDKAIIYRNFFDFPIEQVFAAIGGKPGLLTSDEQSRLNAELEREAFIVSDTLRANGGTDGDEIYLNDLPAAQQDIINALRDVYELKTGAEITKMIKTAGSGHIRTQLSAMRKLGIFAERAGSGYILTRFGRELKTRQESVSPKS